MPEQKPLDHAKLQQYGTFPNKNPKDKRLFFQGLRKGKSVNGRPSSFLSIGGAPRREKTSSMNFPRDILRGVYQITQSVNKF